MQREPWSPPLPPWIYPVRYIHVCEHCEHLCISAHYHPAAECPHCLPPIGKETDAL